MKAAEKETVEKKENGTLELEKIYENRTMELENGLQAIQLTAAIPTLHPPHCAAEKFNELAASGHVTWQFGADQFNPNTESGKRGINSFFNWYFCTFTFAQMVSLTLIVYVQSNMSWAIGLAIPALLMLVACVVFFMGTKNICLGCPATGSPMTSVAQVIVVAVKKRQLKQPDQPLLSLFNYIPPGSINCKLRHTDQFRFLDKAADAEHPRTTNKSRMDQRQIVETLQCPASGRSEMRFESNSHMVLRLKHTYAVFQASASPIDVLGSTSFKSQQHILCGLHDALAMTIVDTYFTTEFLSISPKASQERRAASHCFKKMGIGIASPNNSHASILGFLKSTEEPQLFTNAYVGVSTRRGAVSSMVWLCFGIPQFALAGLRMLLTSIE
ncbi:hypothetical protein CUMW_041060 [Citrus unshiu]|nr:hypothetical protein CUMW_041060 [Citrus unshiu]